MKSQTRLRQLLHARTCVALIGFFALMLVYAVSSFNPVTASNPSSGTLNPTLGATLAWAGAATLRNLDAKSSSLKGSMSHQPGE